MYRNRFCSYRGSYKLGPWTLDWTMPWTGLFKTFGSEEFCRLLNSLQVARGSKEPGACGLKIAHDLYACNTSGWSCDYGCVWPGNVFGALGLSGFILLG